MRHSDHRQFALQDTEQTSRQRGNNTYNVIPASRKMRRKGNQVDSNVWLRVLRKSDQRQITLQVTNVSSLR
jgi:hypothetical protein